MSERSFRRERLRVTTPLLAAGVTLLPVERLVVHVQAGISPLTWYAGSAEPVAVVVHEASGARAFTTEGQPLALGPLLDEVDGLRQALREL